MKIKDMPPCVERQKSHLKNCKCIITLERGFLFCSTHKRHKTTNEIARKSESTLRRRTETTDLIELGMAEYYGES